MKAQWQFWVLAIFVGMFQGGIQALSRSYFAKIVPPERSGEYFGLMDICGKGASFMGTTVVGLASQAFGSINIGISAIVFLFLAGALFFMKTAHSGSESTKIRRTLSWDSRCSMIKVIQYMMRICNRK